MTPRTDAFLEARWKRPRPYNIRTTSAAIVAVLAFAGAAACGSSSNPTAPKWKVVVVE